MLYTQVLDDGVPEERDLGITAGLEFVQVANLTAAYTDLGFSPGMERGLELARKLGRRIELRTLPGW